MNNQQAKTAFKKAKFKVGDSLSLEIDPSLNPLVRAFQVQVADRSIDSKGNIYYDVIRLTGTRKGQIIEEIPEATLVNRQAEELKKESEL